MISCAVCGCQPLQFQIHSWKNVTLVVLVFIPYGDNCHHSQETGYDVDEARKPHQSAIQDFSVHLSIHDTGEFQRQLH